jgi:hypothetical protein
MRAGRAVADLGDYNAREKDDMDEQFWISLHLGKTTKLLPNSYFFLLRAEWYSILVPIARHSLQHGNQNCIKEKRPSAVGYATLLALRSF